MTHVKGQKPSAFDAACAGCLWGYLGLLVLVLLLTALGIVVTLIESR